MIAVTGATGHLGRLVIAQLLEKSPAAQLVAVVRNSAKAADLAAKGVVVRVASYTDPAALQTAFADVEKLLLISSSEVGQRAAQHKNVIDAAQKAGVKLLVYTSLLHANKSPLNLAQEHLQTEEAIKASKLPFVILRNSWYTENYTGAIKGALAAGALFGSAGNGHIASAARADYAAAAVAALLGHASKGKIYELAGDHAYTLAELATEISHQTGKYIPYRNLPEHEYREHLVKAGVPDAMAASIASWDAAVIHGALYDDHHQLSKLIGRPTTTLAQSVKDALKA